MYIKYVYVYIPGAWSPLFFGWAPGSRVKNPGSGPHTPGFNGPILFCPGETRRLPHTALCTSRMSEPAARHDRGQPREKTNGKERQLIDQSRPRFTRATPA